MKDREGGFMLKTLHLRVWIFSVTTQSANVLSAVYIIQFQKISILQSQQALEFLLGGEARVWRDKKIEEINEI